MTSDRLRHANSRATANFQERENHFRSLRARQAVARITETDEQRELRLEVARNIRQWIDKLMNEFSYNERINYAEYSLSG